MNCCVITTHRHFILKEKATDLEVMKHKHTLTKITWLLMCDVMSVFAFGTLLGGRLVWERDTRAKQMSMDRRGWGNQPHFGGVEARRAEERCHDWTPDRVAESKVQILYLFRTFVSILNR